jgi:hypothetical protein
MDCLLHLNFSITDKNPRWIGRIKKCQGKWLEGCMNRTVSRGWNIEWVRSLSRAVRAQDASVVIYAKLFIYFIADVGHKIMLPSLFLLLVRPCSAVYDVCRDGILAGNCLKLKLDSPCHDRLIISIFRIISCRNFRVFNHISTWNRLVYMADLVN